MHQRLNILNPLKNLALGLCVSSFLVLIPEASEAARVTQVKGKQVLVDLAGSDVQVSTGKKYFVVIDGKRRAVVQITKVRGNRAIGQITKGRAAVGATLAAPGGKSSQQASASKPQKSDSSTVTTGSITDQMSFGVLAGYSLDSQEVTSGGTTLSMTGSGLSLKGFGDIPISGPLGLIGRLGVEQFNVEASGRQTEILYATTDLLLRYNFTEGNFVPFGLAGLGIHFPLSKSSTALEVQKISSTTVFFGGLGFNYRINRDMYIVATAEYGMFPPSNDVKTSLIAIRGGLGMRF